jgi:hypothetical protein
LCLNELVLGVGLRPPMCSVFREKVGAATFRRMILEAVRFKVSCFACPEVCMRFLREDETPTLTLFALSSPLLTFPIRLWTL